MLITDSAREGGADLSSEKQDPVKLTTDSAREGGADLSRYFLPVLAQKNRLRPRGRGGFKLMFAIDSVATPFDSAREGGADLSLRFASLCPDL